MKKEIEDIWPSWKVCKFFSISRASLSKWRQRGCPSEKRGYNIFKVFDWYRCNVISDPGVETNLAEEKLLRERAKRELDELRAAKERGSLIDRHQSISWLSQIVSEAKSALLNLPRRLAEMLVGRNAKEIEAILRFEIHEILWRLSGLPRPEASKELAPWDRDLFQIVIGKDGKRKKVLKPKKSTQQNNGGILNESENKE